MDIRVRSGSSLVFAVILFAKSDIFSTGGQSLSKLTTLSNSFYSLKESKL